MKEKGRDWLIQNLSFPFSLYPNSFQSLPSPIIFAYLIDTFLWHFLLEYPIYSFYSFCIQFGKVGDNKRE